MPNSFAFVVLFSWPLVVFLLFHKLPRPQALIVSIFGGYLLLPFGVGINPPILPTFDKTLIPALSAAIMCLFIPDPTAKYRRRYRRQPPSATVKSEPLNSRNPAKTDEDIPTGEDLSSPLYVRASRIELVLLALLFLTPFITVLTNPGPYDTGYRVLPGLVFYDAFSMGLTALVSVLPFILGRRYLPGSMHHIMLLIGLCVAGLLYSLPALFEVRMSPQLSRWVYGFLAQPFVQAMRDGGFRPVVFLQHGLWLAILLAKTVLSAFTLWRHERPSLRWLLAGLWLLGTLVLCHSFGALAIAALLLPAVIFLSISGQLLTASAIAFVILLYPVFRGAGLVPIDEIVEIARLINPGRANSLEFRLKNEDILLAHAEVKPLAGWGGWGRSRVYDKETGRDISITDGLWIIIIGGSGWLGYIAQFGLLTTPIFLILFRRRRLEASIATSGLCIILSANLIDMIPNATLTPVTWLVAGALMGRSGLERDTVLRSIGKKPAVASRVRHSQAIRKTRLERNVLNHDHNRPRIAHNGD
jgi:hypothetical protein